jgi:CelD/BcsL family acetyltransferase involved in cellulose biosynthesis
VRLVSHNNIPADACLAGKWNELVHRMECPEVFYTYEWALAVSRAYGAAITPLLFLAYEGASLIGVVALATDARNRAIFFLASATADYCDFICRPERRPEFVRAVLAELRKRKCGRLVLSNLPADSATPLALGDARRQGYFVFTRPAYLCAQVAICSQDQRESTGQSVGRRLRRFRKAMGQDLQISVRHSRAFDEIDRAFLGFARAHVARFLATGRISNLARAARRDFLIELARLLSPSESVGLSRLMLGDRSIAWNFGFQFSGSWFWYQPTFDPAFQQYSPGVWLLTAIAQEAVESPAINRVDLGLGAEGYKERLANSSRQTLHITASRSLFVHLGGLLRHRAAAVVKSMPPVELFIRSARTIASSMRARLQNEGITECLLKFWRHAGARLSPGSGQVILLEWEGDKRSSSQSTIPAAANIVPVDLNLLADAAMHYEGDSETLNYLLRASALLAAKASGFASVDDAGIPFHFCWTTDFDLSSFQQLEYRLSNQNSDCVLISNCWTPVSVRDNEYKQAALCALASRLRAAGKRTWTAVPSRDVGCAREMEEAGFVRRFTATGKHHLVRNIIDASPGLKVVPPEASVSTAA